jgi:hypothetical protein
MDPGKIGLCVNDRWLTQLEVTGQTVAEHKLATSLTQS